MAPWLIFIMKVYINKWQTTDLREGADVADADHADGEVAVEVDDVQRARAQAQQHVRAENRAQQLEQDVCLAKQQYKQIKNVDNK